MVCGTRKGIHAHHLRSQQVARMRGIGLKSPDQWTVSLCWLHHDECHRIGSRRERSWMIAECGIDPYALADALWRVSPDETQMYRVLLAHQLAASSALLERKPR